MRFHRSRHQLDAEVVGSDIRVEAICGKCFCNYGLEALSVHGECAGSGEGAENDDIAVDGIAHLDRFVGRGNKPGVGRELMNR